jgi:peptide/nickel transport system ATP-binding protein
VTPAIELRGLRREFRVRQGLFAEPKRVIAVDDVSFAVPAGSVLGVVGESGCGKSTLARLILGLLEPSAGEVAVDGQRISAMDRRARARLIQPVFQDPFASLNPKRRVRDIVAMPLIAQGSIGVAEIDRRVAEALERVGLSADQGTRFPAQLSGGQRQRVAIARALVLRPRIVVCDEPTSALDVSVQAQILNLMKELQQRLNLTFLFISHNLAVVRQVSDRIGVMYLGRLAELAPAETLFRRPRHPYTRALMEAIPDLDMTGRERIPVGGEVPSPITPPSGCAFHPRCPLANDRCKRERPELKPAGDAMVACHAVEEGRDDAMPMPALARSAA